MSNHLPTQYQQFIGLSRYARWIPDEARRETFVETVERYMANVVRRVIRDEAIIDSIQDAILSLSIMPSMRMMMTAGPALDRDNTAGYNCAYVAVDDPKAFDESMMILLCGTGVGFSVERQHIAKMPEVPEKLFPSGTRLLFMILRKVGQRHIESWLPCCMPVRFRVGTHRRYAHPVPSCVRLVVVPVVRSL